MNGLALVLFAPWFAVLAWVYWRYPRDLPGTAARRGFDLAALALAIVASASAMQWLYVGNTGVGGSIWRDVIAALGAYGGFVAVLVVAVVLRRALWRPTRR